MTRPRLTWSSWFAALVCAALVSCEVEPEDPRPPKIDYNSPEAANYQQHIYHPIPPDQEPEKPPYDDVSLGMIVVATDIVNKWPVGMRYTYRADVGKLYCFSEILSRSRAVQRITHVWSRNGLIMAEVPLPVQGPRWRTWSSKQIPPDWTGDWTVSVLSPTGRNLGQVTFRVGY